MSEKERIQRISSLRRAAFGAILSLAFASAAGAQGVYLVMDEDSIDNGTGSIERISFNAPFCGKGNPAVCVNDDIANPAVRTLLFTRPSGSDITPYWGLTLPTGQVGDEGLFRFSLPDPQRSLQNGATFTTQQFFDATGAASNENNLDKIDGVVPLNDADIRALAGRTVCAVVFDSDVSVNEQPRYASLKGATLGVTAFRVVSVSSHPAGGSYLPLITVNLLHSSQVRTACADVFFVPG